MPHLIDEHNKKVTILNKPIVDMLVSGDLAGYTIKESPMTVPVYRPRRWFERIFSFTPWRDSELIRVPSEAIYILQAKKVIMCHPSIAEEIRTFMRGIQNGDFQMPVL